MTAEELKAGTKKFALQVIKLVNALPNYGTTTTVLGKQLIRCGTSVAANYRAACRAKSTADFIAKMGIVEEEVDEAAFWIEMLVESGLVKKELVSELADEANQLTAIVVASINTARGGKR